VCTGGNVDSSFIMPLGVAICFLLTHYQNKTVNLQLHAIILSAAVTRKRTLFEKHAKHLQQIASKDHHISTESINFINYSKGTCPLKTKLKFVSILPPSLSSVLYLDADVLVRANIQQLWKIAKHTSTLAAVIDVGKASRPYFNAGLMVINLNYMREPDLEQKMLSYVDDSPEGSLASFQMKEQDVLNKFFHNWQQFFNLLECSRA
jgi:lipopolysaccharide biosynthesis glycosyltransferase